MINIHDSKYYDFAGKLKENLEDTFAPVLETAKTYFQNSNLPYNGNFTTYLKKTDYLNPHKSKNQFIIEIDGHNLLDLQGYYDDKEDNVYDYVFLGILYAHTTWKADQFSEIKLSDAQCAEFISLQEEFIDNLKKIGMYGITTIPEFNPDRDTIPESVVEFYFDKKRKFDYFLTHTDILHQFLTYYYEYNFKVKNKFNSYIPSHLK